MLKKRIIVTDVEAPCADREKFPNFPQEIIEIGAVDTEGREFSCFVKPVRTKKLTDYCKKLTGIKQEDVDNAKGFKEAYQDFLDFIHLTPEEDTIIMSSGDYDKYQFLKDFKYHGMTEEVDFIENNHRNIKFYYKEVTGYRYRSTAKVLRKFGYKRLGTQHRALWDSKTSMQIVQTLLEMEKNKKTGDKK